MNEFVEPLCRVTYLLADALVVLLVFVRGGHDRGGVVYPHAVRSSRGHMLRAARGMYTTALRIGHPCVVFLTDTLYMLPAGMIVAIMCSAEFILLLRACLNRQLHRSFPQRPL